MGADSKEARSFILQPQCIHRRYKRLSPEKRPHLPGGSLPPCVKWACFYRLFGAHIKYFPQGEGLLGRSDGFLSVVQEVKKLTWVLTRPRFAGRGKGMKGSRTKGAEGQDGRALPSPRPALPWDSAGFQSAASTCLVVVDQGIWEGTGLGHGQKK